MCSKGFLKRMLPFFATFAIGVFIASFFVSLSGRGFRGHGRHHEIQRLRIENEELRNENMRLVNEIESFHWKGVGHGDEIPDIEFAVPLHPEPPTVPRVKR